MGRYPAVEAPLASRAPSPLALAALLSCSLFMPSAGCGDDADLPDGAAVDAARDATPDALGDAAIDTGADAGPLAVRLEGPPAAFVDEEYCLTVAHNGGPATSVSIVWDAEGPQAIEAGVACHTFPFPGERLVSVTAAEGAMRAEASRVVPVVFRPAPVPPTRSSSIAYDPRRDRVWVVNPDADTVSVLSAEPLALLAEIDVGDRPRTLTIAGATVAVACQGDDSLHLVDADALAPTTVVDLGYGSAPYGVAADPRGGRVWVSRLQAADLVSVDVPSGRVRRDLDLGLDPRGVAVAADGAILVTRWRADVSAAYVYQVDASDAAAPALVGTIELPRQEGLDSDTNNDGVLSFLNQAVFSPDGARALIPALKANVVAGTFNGDRALTSQTTARAALAEVLRDPADAASLGRDSFRFAFDDLDYASALAFSPLGDRVYVAFQGSEAILVLDAFSFNVTGSIDDVGAAVQGIALSPDGTRLYVQAFLDREVRVYDVTDLATEPESLAVVRTVATEPLAPAVLEGKRIFYRSRDPRMSRTSYLSCASCHLDGEGDNLTWDFTQRGEGLRNTIPLRGRGGLGHGLLHWSANFDEVQDFEHDIRGGQGGTGFMSEAEFRAGTRDQPLGDAKAGVTPELDALAAYLTSLADFGRSPFRREGDATFEAAFARGAAVFARADTDCASCHDGAAFTDSGEGAPAAPRLHDVGTLRGGSGERLGGPLVGLDTPTVRGLWRSAPFLHDGSAPTLRAVLTTRNATDLHGVTSTLSPGDLDDLLVYLRALDDRVP